MGYTWVAIAVGAIIVAGFYREDKNEIKKLTDRIDDLESEINDLKRVITGGRTINPDYDPEWSPNRNRDGTEKNLGDVLWDSERKPWRKYDEEK